MPEGCRECYGVQSQVIPSAPEAVPIEGDEISPMAALIQQEQLPPPVPPPTAVFVGPNDSFPIGDFVYRAPRVDIEPSTGTARSRSLFADDLNVPTTRVAPPNDAELTPMIRGTQPCC